MNFIERVLVQHHEQLGLAATGLRRDVETTLLTPRFVTSRHVVALVYSRGESRPRVVVKVPRQPSDREGIQREAEMLQRLEALMGRGNPSIPRMLGVVACDGHALLVESVVQGMPLTPQLVRRHFKAAMKAAVSFIEGMPLVRPAENNTEWYQSAVVQPLARLTAVAPLAGRTADLCARTHAVLEPLRSAPLPAVFEHGDLCHPNLLLESGADRLGAIDWERSTVDGVPGHDLVFFLEYMSESRRSAFSRPEQLAAFDQAFVGSDAWAVPILREHLRYRGVDPELWELLVVTSWARSAATLATRLAPGGSGDNPCPPVTVEAAVDEDRDSVLWRHALELAERGRFRG